MDVVAPLLGLTGVLNHFQVLRLSEASRNLVSVAERHKVMKRMHKTLAANWRLQHELDAARAKNVRLLAMNTLASIAQGNDLVYAKAAAMTHLQREMAGVDWFTLEEMNGDGHDQYNMWRSQSEDEESEDYRFRVRGTCA